MDTQTPSWKSASSAESRMAAGVVGYRKRAAGRLPTSVWIANGAYQQAFDAGGLTWMKNEGMVTLPTDWQKPLAQLLES